MRCQHCQVNEATIRLNMQVNSSRNQMVLCEDCYTSLMEQSKMKMGPQLLEEVHSSLNRQVMPQTWSSQNKKAYSMSLAVT